MVAANLGRNAADEQYRCRICRLDLPHRWGHRASDNDGRSATDPWPNVDNPGDRLLRMASHAPWDAPDSLPVGCVERLRGTGSRCILLNYLYAGY